MNDIANMLFIAFVSYGAVSLIVCLLYVILRFAALRSGKE